MRNSGKDVEDWAARQKENEKSQEPLEFGKVSHEFNQSAHLLLSGPCKLSQQNESKVTGVMKTANWQSPPVCWKKYNLVFQSIFTSSITIWYAAASAKDKGGLELVICKKGDSLQSAFSTRLFQDTEMSK